MHTIPLLLALLEFPLVSLLVSDHGINLNNNNSWISSYLNYWLKGFFFTYCPDGGHRRSRTNKQCEVSAGLATCWFNIYVSCNM